MSAVVAVVGEGVLAELVCGELISECRIVRLINIREGLPEDVEFALVLNDAWHPAVHREAEVELLAAGIPWLRGFVAFGEGVVGPLVRPGQSGCSRCADTRQLIAGRDRMEMWGLQQRLTETGGIPSDTWASRTGLLQMAHLITAESRNVLRRIRSRTEEHVVLVNLKTLNCSSHFFLPDPLCPICGRLPEDSRDAARISLKPSPKVGENIYRSRSLQDLKAFLARDYLDYKIGFLNGKMLDLISPLADATVNLPMLEQDEVTAGRTNCYADSELSAILEGLERYCGMAPRGKRPVVRGSYRQLSGEALDPVTVGLYAEEQYELPGFPFSPFDPDTETDWVWGYSFAQGRPILVPQWLAYYSSPCRQGFVYETSNGCALGGSLEEAIMYGMLEVVERDSFLLTWYAQLPLPRLDPQSAGDRDLKLMVDRLRAVAGFDVLLFNATMENGIPSIWAVAKNRKPNGVNLICAAGAHPDPVRAAKGAVHELSGMMLTLDHKFEANREDYVRMLHNPSLVRGMEDHSLLYSLPEAEPRLRFLLEENRPMRAFAQEFGPTPEHPDLTEDLKVMIGKFLQLHLDVIVVDQSTPELRRNGLHCVKVLMPGMLPMTFGYHFTRLAGLERALRVPTELGYTERPLRPEELNAHPHPFP
ncbi:TOMM precursor leader peptide-binding protein [Paenibacillus frigoriresistens]|uniref:TOMM precursor leader peptide-binding protein n=1 Tax=Paenibacillus alginolyticus TaxID=59839 RepID=UPI00156494D7|nr:TOMM precursor leader peptide-binding protein [Paenibacillus frigoriresistens]NRF96208.1 TOMM precursor leader peptide-binding protein [Paenibacillus frigoriresistens]